MIALPNKLSGLLELAVEDAQRCAALPDIYTLDMGNWHYGRRMRINGQIHCNVCMAGSVIAQTLKLDPSEHEEDPEPDEDAFGARAEWDSYLAAAKILRGAGL